MSETVRDILVNVLANKAHKYTVRDGALDRLLAGYEGVRASFALAPRHEKSAAISAWLKPALEDECRNPDCYPPLVI